jgi:rRNA maturation endonuclease Nob1
MNVVRHVQEYLLMGHRRNEQSQEPTRDPSQLYRCRACSETYISTGMDACPRCSTSVEIIPSERDLGFV